MDNQPITHAVLNDSKKNFIIKEREIVKLGFNKQALFFIRTTFEMINSIKGKGKLKNLNNNTTINSIFNNVPENDNVFKQIVNLVLRQGTKKYPLFRFIFSGYNYNPQTNQLRFYLYNQFVLDYLKKGKYIKTRLVAL